MEYSFKLPPFDHQVVEWKHLLKSQYGGTLSEMGAGKTLPILASTEARIRWGLAKRALYVAPDYLLSKIKQQVEMCTGLSCEILQSYTKSGKKSTRKKRVAKFAVDAQIHIINIEAVRRFERLLSANNYDIVIVDEAHKIKGYSSASSKALQRLGAKAKFRIIATGTPVTKEPEDIFGIMLFVDKDILGKTITPFRERYCNRVDKVIGWGARERTIQVTSGVKSNMADELRSKYESLFIRHTKDQCLQLPPKFHEVRRVALTAPIAKIYNDALNNHILALPDGAIVEMKNQGVLTNRLAQICSGFLQYPDPMDPGKDKIYRFGQSNKMVALQDILEARTEQKTIVWAVYRESIRDIAKQFAGFNPVVMMGGSDHADAIRRFQSDSGVRLAVVQTQINAGYEMTESDCNVYFEMPASYSDWKQSQDRTHRPGAEKWRQIMYFLLVTNDTVEPSIRVGLKRKEDLADLLLRFSSSDVLTGQLEDNQDDM